MIPSLKTRRLLLNPFTQADVPGVVELAGNREVSRMTANIPHPYSLREARIWIAGHLLSFLSQQSVCFAIRHEGALIGCVSLGRDPATESVELGYWLGQPFWNQGFATEAALACVAFGFDHFRLQKVVSRHLARNRASGRVLQKLGMKQEGYLRRAFYRDKEWHDVVLYGLLPHERVLAPL